MKDIPVDLSDVNAMFPRSATYDITWVLENQMGPNVLWLTEFLSQAMDLKPGMRILDLGCGKAISSIFLAKEFDVEVWATDLWIGANENWRRICAAGAQDRVFPVHAEAHTLPFADQFFDAVTSLDAYHYFGTDELFLGTFLTRYLKPGGQIGIVVPGLVEEFSAGVPKHLQSYWEWEFYSFHSPKWWRNHWEKTGLVSVEFADFQTDGWEQWLKWQELRLKTGFAYEEAEAEMLRVDAGRCLGFTRMVARKI